jgi:hypothetical protein
VRHTARPAGTPIGRALDIPAGLAYDDLREVVEAIDRVHGDGELPRVPVRLVEGFPVLGRFRFDPTSGAPVSIVVRADQAYRQLSLLHEIGHLIDWCVLGERATFGSTVHPMMSAWLDRVEDSQAYGALDSLVRRGSGMLADGRIVMLTERESTAVWRALVPEECWARSYAQYVAVRSRDLDLATSLTGLLTPSAGRVYYPLQWGGDDFQPIAEAIDDLFGELEWRIW